MTSGISDDRHEVKALTFTYARIYSLAEEDPYTIYLYML